MPSVPMPRSQDNIFADLRSLALSEGAMHEISAIVYRDWALTIDTEEGKVKDEPTKRWSTDKLNTNELLLLLGLMVQSSSDQTYATVKQGCSFTVAADKLLREFHDRVIADAASVSDPTSQKFLEAPNSLGIFAREAIYYGAASFYLHQFAKLARERYREDSIWLLQNAGISIRPIIDIAQFIVRRITRQMSGIKYLWQEGRELTHGDLTDSLLIEKAGLRKRFGGKADAFIAKFATKATGANAEFTEPFSVNEVFIAPLIDIGDYLYVPNQYRLLESVYESPFYWMVRDDAYAGALSKHRGAFLEGTAEHALRKVFGSENVFVNATFPVAQNQIGGEVDVLVCYGEFVIVVQAKSKRITLKARAGDPDALKTDFKGAIQDPYKQALASCDLITAGAKCVDAEGSDIALPTTPRVFPLVVLSDAFPAATSLSHRLLHRPEGSPAPVIWDIGVLDCVARVLPTPIEMLFYLKCRGDVFDTIISDSEFNYLGYHLKLKLALPPEVDFMIIERDFATVVDDFMIAADLDLDVERPRGILEEIEIPLVSPLLAELKSAPPEIAAVVLDLYDFSSVALEEVSKNILALRAEVAKRGMKLKAFSILTGSGGFSYVVSPETSPTKQQAAIAIGRKNKYENRADRWYVIFDSLETDQLVDGLLPLVWPWKENAGEDEAVQRAGTVFKSIKVPVVIGGGEAEQD